MHAFCSIDQFGQFLQNILHMNIQISNEHLRHEYIRIDHFVLSSIHSWARSIVKHPQCRCDAEVLNQEKYICQKVHNVSPGYCGFSAKHLKPSNIYNITKTRPKGLEKSAKMGDRDGRHCYVVGSDLSSVLFQSTMLRYLWWSYFCFCLVLVVVMPINISGV